MFSKASLVLVLVAVASANEIQEKLCKMGSTPEGKAKIMECAAKAPPRSMELNEECRKELGEEATPLEEFYKKVCDGGDIAKKFGECTEKKFMAEMEKDDEFMSKMGPVMECFDA